MRLAPIKRLLTGLAAGALLLAFIDFAYVQTQERILRHRAEHLLADFHSIELNHSTWADAQTLIHRWGRWGHYDGTCTATACEYQVVLSRYVRTADELHSSLAGIEAYTHPHLLRWKVPQTLNWLLDTFLGRSADMSLQFAIRDGFITQTKFEASVASSGSITGEPSYGSLVLIAQSARSLSGPHMYGRNTQLEDHPDYKIGRPDGCESCLMAKITYTPQLSKSEGIHLTTLDISCFTRLNQCVILEQLIPPSSDWHLYGFPWGEDKTERAGDKPSHPCRTPLWAVGRDAAEVYSVEALTDSASPPSDSSPLNQIRIIERLRGIPGWPSGSSVAAATYDGWMGAPYDIHETMTAGKRYIIVKEGALGTVYVPPEKPYQIGMNRCGVFDDTPKVRQQLQQGFVLRGTRPDIIFPHVSMW